MQVSFREGQVQEGIPYRYNIMSSIRYYCMKERQKTC